MGARPGRPLPHVRPLSLLALSPSRIRLADSGRSSHRYVNAELSLARLTTAPISLSNVTFSGYDGVQHSWNGDMLDDVVDWFEAHVPRHRAAGASAGAGAGERGGGEAQLGNAESGLEKELEQIEAGARAGGAQRPQHEAAASSSTSTEDPFDAPAEDASSAVDDEARLDDLDRLDALAVADDLVPARLRRRRRLDRNLVDLSARSP